MSASNKGPNVDPRLQNLTNALYLDGNDDVVVRTGFVGNIVISGNVNVPGTIVVDSTPTDPVHTHVSEIGTSGILDVPYMPIGGNVIVTSLPAITGNVTSVISGNISGITSLPAITGNVNANVTGSVSVSSLPAITGNVTSVINGNISGITSLPSITGNVNANITAMPSITGNVTSVISGNISGITSLPAITGNVTSTISGNISGITSLPAITGNVTSTISGNISGITSLPAITGNVTSVITGNISGITSLPAITGNVNANVTGSVSVSSLPAITGNVNANVSGNVGILGNVNVTQGTSPWVINVGQGPQVDTTGRLRVSTVQQSWHYTPTVDKDGDLRLNEKFVDTGASYFIHNLASVNMTSGTGYNANVALTGTAIRGSRRRFKMRPGVAHEWLGTFNFDGIQSGVTKRAGMFTNYNGMFFQLDTTLNLVIRRRLMNGTMIETVMPRGTWNGDNLDGTGASGEDWTVADKVVNITSAAATTPITVYATTVYNVTFTVDDVTKFALGNKVQVTGITPTSMNAVGMVDAIGANTITLTFVTNPGSFVSASNAKMTQSPYHMMHTMWFDFQGGRANTIRFGMNSPKGAVVLHTYNTNGQLSTQYENAPALMERKEIVNTGAVSVIPSFTIAGTCFNVEAELELNPGFGVAVNNNTVSFPKGGTAEYPILGVGLRAGEPYQRSDLQLQGLTLSDIANINQQNAGVFYWRLVLNPTLGGTVPASTDIGKTTRQWAYTTATTVTGGIDLLSGYASSTQQFDVRTALNFVNLGSNIDYTDADKVVLVVKQLVGGTSDAKIVATINFIEAL